MLTSLVAGVAGAGVAAADPADTREAALREPAVEVAAADLRTSWRVDAIGATESVAAGGELTSLATASVGGEVAVSHEACDIVVAGGQADLRTGDQPLSFQQWASLCPLAGILRLELDHRLAWDVRPRLLAPPRLRPGASRRETIGIEMVGATERWNDPGPLSLAPPPAEYTMAVYARMDVGFGWLAGAGAPLDLQAKADMRGFGFRRERDDGSTPLEVWVFAAKADILTRDDVMSANLGAAARFDAVEVTGARAAGLRWGGRLGVGMGFVSGGEGARARVASVLTGLGELSVERDVVRKPDDLLTVRGTAGRDAWPLWDGRLVVDDRVTAEVAIHKRRLSLRSQLALARSHLVAVDGTVTDGTTGGLTQIADLTVTRHLTLRSRTEVGVSAYAPGATADAPGRAVETTLTAVLHAGSR